MTIAGGLRSLLTVYTRLEGSRTTFLRNIHGESIFELFDLGVVAVLSLCTEKWLGPAAINVPLCTRGGDLPRLDCFTLHLMHY